MELGLNGKRALVMGSTRGMGQGIATRLSAEGANVAVCGRKLRDAEKTAANIEGSRAYALNLEDENSITMLIEHIKADFGDIDIIVCNGGGPSPGNIANVTAETWAAQFQTMFINQLTIVNTFLPGMRDRGWGRILVVSSSGIVQPITNLGISNAIRASQVGWAKTLSSEVAAEGVTINTLAPGRIHTDRVNQIDAATAAKQGKPVEDVAKASHATIPMGRYGTVAEFADTAVYLLSDNASYITGSIIRVDGGMIRSV
ncbi:MAG: 3-oxoacyl-ACP reductase [Rhodospirillaceae bacterium]|nr:3-oxoacyl-ACP reductase [Rhodospirillaceae bacterium]